jgi:EpsD family peptidyl-prolyl cis-trans isomerase
MRRPSRRHMYLLLAFCIGSVAGCGRSDHRAGAIQVAARVNSEEISVRQVEYALTRTADDRSGSSVQARRRILDKLIDEKLASQQAVRNKLDRAPAAIAALDLARSEVLARSLVQSIAAAQPMPTNEEIDKYYSAHPELFEQRRVFDLDEIIFTTTEPVAGALRNIAATARSMRDIGDWLKSRGIEFAEDRVVRAAERVPLDVLPKLQAMTDGQVALVDADRGRFHLVQVVTSRTVPVDRATAVPRIREFLHNRRVMAAVAAEIARLKQKSKIEYLGEFAARARLGEPSATSKVSSTAQGSRSRLQEPEKAQTE